MTTKEMNEAVQHIDKIKQQKKHERIQGAIIAGAIANGDKKSLSRYKTEINQFNRDQKRYLTNG